MTDAPSQPDLRRLLSRGPRRPDVPMLRYVVGHVLALPMLLAALAWALQHGDADMLVTRLFVDPAAQSFRWRDALLLDVVGHHAARGLPFLVGGLALAAGLAALRIAWLRPWAGILLCVAACTTLGPLAINGLKGMTTQHCPAALQGFGGVVDYAADRAAPFWAATRQAAGHCLPSGHAGGGYALLSLYFAGWAAGQPAWRWRGLALGVVAGLVFSAVRLAQGAHFASATVWSASVDFAVCALVFMPLLCARPSKGRSSRRMKY